MQASSKPFLFILTTFAIVLAISFFGNSFTVFGLQLKNINIISDILPGDKAEPAVPNTPDSHSSSLDPHLPDFSNSSIIIGYEDKGPLYKFIQALHELAKGNRSKVRIGYFGDSMIEGDLITQDLRNLLQAYFGGNGVGFVPITSVVAGFRQSIQHTFSDNWTDQNYLNSSSKNKNPLFISGHLFMPSGYSTVSYKVPSFDRNTIFNDCYLLYGQHDSASYFAVGDSTFKFEFNSLLNKQLIGRNLKEIRGSFSGREDVFYGFSFESQRGIFVDNLAFRGISGIELKRISHEMLDAVNQVHPYDLIILQYGPNLLFKPELTDFDWYEKPMNLVLQNLKSHNPNASILVIGSADKSCRYDGNYQTQKGVLPLIAIQHSVAKQEEVNFWNLFNAMGGVNSMMRWVKMQPPLANVDYTHLTHKGARTIAKSLFDQIMLVYDPQAASRSQIQPIARYVSASRNM